MELAFVSGGRLDAFLLAEKVKKESKLELAFCIFGGAGAFFLAKK